MVSPRPIFLVEDNPDDERLTIRTLQRSYITNEIQVACDGEEALGMISRAMPLPYVVLLDLKLPKIDGIEVLQHIRSNERTRLLPIVILTSSSEECDIVESYSGGTNGYLQKPVDFEQFTKAVTQLGLLWALTNEPVPEQQL